MIQKQSTLLKNPIWMASFIALILIAVAILKWAFPSAKDPYFYFIVGGFEMILAAALVIFASSWRVWALLILVLSLWSGFSFYTTLFDFPCACLGGALPVPRGSSFVLSALLFLGAWAVLSHHPSHPVTFKKILWFFTLFFMFGFISSVVYYNYQT